MTLSLVVFFPLSRDGVEGVGVLLMGKWVVDGEDSGWTGDEKRETETAWRMVGRRVTTGET
jgi:hypothetical protein